MTVTLDNRTMRRLWLDTNGLLASASGPLDVVAIIRKLGFVQLDSIQNVSRAHHHILWSRHNGYREHMLDDLLSAREHLFEHFTHDAAVLPMETYPMWQRRFKLLQNWIDGRSWHKPERVEEWQDVLIKRIREEGPLSTKDFESHKKGEKKVWSRPPHKHVLDYLWYSGALATSHREKFTKFYDLAERVIPDEHRTKQLSDDEQVDWLCRAALEKLAVGTPKEIKEFWDAKAIGEVKAWVAANEAELASVKWQTNSGDWVQSYALKDIEERIEQIPTASSHMKIINPFDPAVRNRVRLKALFGFDYKLEVFVPEAKRKWGYYVYPLLEGDRFVGRIEAKADHKAKCLNVMNFWPEDGVNWTASRKKKLEAELIRFAKLDNLGTVAWR